MMTTQEIEEYISQYRRDRQVQYETMMESLHTVQNCLSKITTCDEMVEELLRKEIEELRRQLMIAQRDEIK